MDWNRVEWKVPVSKVEEAQLAAEENLRQQKGPWAVLNELQRQQVTIARLELTASPCPLCRFPLNVPVARMAYEELLGKVSEIKDEHHACPRCGVQLVFCVPLLGSGYVWELKLSDEQIQAVCMLSSKRDG